MNKFQPIRTNLCLVPIVFNVNVFIDSHGALVLGRQIWTHEIAKGLN